jgi:hypothetical protein
MKKIIKVYKKGVDKNLKDINSILKKAGTSNLAIIPVCKNILLASSQNMTNKWATGRKYVRTQFAKKAFGKYYPKKQIELSLTIDGIINILDDLVDETMDNKERILYLTELSRAISVYNLCNHHKSIQVAFGHYFNKIILLSVAENYYEKLIKKEKDFNKIIKISVEIFNYRSMDIDIFNEIALINHKNKKAISKIMEIGRIFRAVNIIKKDIKDIDYDLQTKVETAITLMFKNKKYNFSEK